MYLSAHPHGEDFFDRELIETMLRNFEEQNPDIQVTLLGTESAVGESKKSNSAEEKTADILIFDDGELRGLIAKGELLPLETFPYNTENSAAPEPAGDKDGARFAIPLVSFMDLLFYNIELLQSEGFDRPPKTRDEFLSYAKAVSDGSGVYGAAMGLSPKDRQAVSREFFSWIWASGNDFWSDGDTPVFDSRPVIRDIDFLGRLSREGSLAPNSFDKTGEQVLEEFARGKIAMIVASARAIPDLIKKMEDGANSGGEPAFQFGITTLPLASDSSAIAGKYSIGLSGIYAGISAAADTYPEARLQARNQAAITFLEFLAEQVPRFCAELKAVPGDAANLYSSDYKNYMMDDPVYSKAWYIFESSQIVQGFSENALGAEYEKIVREEMQTLFETNRTAAETAEAIQERINKISEKK